MVDAVKNFSALLLVAFGAILIFKWLIERF